MALSVHSCDDRGRGIEEEESYKKKRPVAVAYRKEIPLGARLVVEIEPVYLSL